MSCINACVFVANEELYNMGTMYGDWIDLPVTEEVFEQFLKDKVFMNNSQNWIVLDEENDLGYLFLDKFDIYEASDILMQIERLNEYEYDALYAYLDSVCNDIERALDVIRNGDYIYYLNDDIEKLGVQLMYDNGLGKYEIEHLFNYINFREYVEDQLDGAYETEFGYLLLI